MSRHSLLAGAASLSFMLAACGGGGSEGLASTPPPPPPPTATPANLSSIYPFSAPPAGVTSSVAFASIGALQSVHWNAEATAYELEFDGYTNARPKVMVSGEFAESAVLLAADGTALPYSMLAWTGFSYTRFGHIGPMDSSAAGDGGAFAFGIATLPGGVPMTGTATYLAQIDGHAGDWGLYGNALFQFDFGAGTLSGYMDPHTNGPMESPELPRYNFTQTVFSQGSTTFSGSFDVIGPSPSSFSGQFTGPHAEELMASFSAPFLDWSDGTEVPDTWNVMEGVIVGKRP
jgi:hypothetical protein